MLDSRTWCLRNAIALDFFLLWFRGLAIEGIEQEAQEHQNHANPLAEKKWVCEEKNRCQDCKEFARGSEDGAGKGAQVSDCCEDKKLCQYEQRYIKGTLSEK